ncbi:hypothetical protein PsYK624_125920 [Phanerochaete sordida]|uniref:Uncharacterized protein n=1 Tax=Phanerochaete sordida TaxID=48140 RepID=A0A9P3GK07_9APHY|nr:hypothetical protein PsYK624_125920 [Phanerochaete sordida]
MFAPLPPTESRRRASHMQHAVAARPRMLRARRMRVVDPDSGEAYIQVVDAALIEQQLQQGAPHYMYPGEAAPAPAADGDRTARRAASRAVLTRPAEAGSGHSCKVPGDEATPKRTRSSRSARWSRALRRKVAKSQKVYDTGAADAAAQGEVEGTEA